MDSDVKTSKLRLMCQQKLVETGEKHRLMDFLRERLQETGYNDELLHYCKSYIRSKGVEHIDIESLVNDVTPRARQLVPDLVKRELLQKIRDFINNEMQKGETTLARS